MRSMLTLLLAILSLAVNVCAQTDVNITLVVTTQVMSPACSPRLSLVVNGTMPGPELHFYAGQHVHIRYSHPISRMEVDGRVYNQADGENITMHWHGLTQYGSPFSDGTPAASQWPIPPGKYFDYEFMFDDDVSGTLYSPFIAWLICSWYHSHVGVGTMTANGAIILHQSDGSSIDSNCPIPYDEELVVFISDLFNSEDGDLITIADAGIFIGGSSVPPNSIATLTLASAYQWETMGYL